MRQGRGCAARGCLSKGSIIEGSISQGSLSKASLSNGFFQQGLPATYQATKMCSRALSLGTNFAAASDHRSGEYVAML